VIGVSDTNPANPLTVLGLADEREPGGGKRAHLAGSAAGRAQASWRAGPKPGGANEIWSSAMRRVVADAARAQIALRVVDVEAMLSMQGRYQR